MSDAIRQLFALFDIDSGSAITKLDEMNKKTSGVKDVLTSLATTALGAFSFHKISEFTTEMIELGSHLNDTSEKLGVSTEELQKFQMAAGQSGVGADEAAKALQFLSKNMGEALSGNADAAKQFAQMGISLKDSSGEVRELGDVIPEAADAFEKMGSSQERTAAAMKLFGKSGASMIPLLKEGSGELKRLYEQFDKLGLGIDQDFIKKADAAGDSLDILKLGFRSLKTRMAAEVLPSITEGAKKLSTWIAWAISAAKETNIVKEAWYGLGIAGAVAAGKMIYSWSKVLGLFPKGGSLMTNLFKMGEIGLIIGAIILLAGSIEDIVVMCQGGQSVIGDFLDEFLGVEKKQELVDSLTQAWDQMQPSLEAIGPLIAEIGSAFAGALPYAIALVVDLMRVVLAAGLAIQTLVHAIAGMADGKSTWSQIGDRFMKDSDAIFGSKGVLSTSTFADTITAPATVGAGHVRQATSYQRGDTNVDITVQGGPTNADTGRAVAAGVENGVSKADRRAAAQTLFRGPPGEWDEQ